MQRYSSPDHGLILYEIRGNVLREQKKIDVGSHKFRHPSQAAMCTHTKVNDNYEPTLNV